jgi:hypothetical protein
MAAGHGKPIDAEILDIEAALTSLDSALTTLQSALLIVSGELTDGGEPFAMPNYRRAGQQLQTAINAASGARNSLQRRLALRRSARDRGHPTLSRQG